MSGMGRGCVETQISTDLRGSLPISRIEKIECSAFCEAVNFHTLIGGVFSHTLGRQSTLPLNMKASDGKQLDCEP